MRADPSENDSTEEKKIMFVPRLLLLLDSERSVDCIGILQLCVLYIM